MEYESTKHGPREDEDRKKAVRSLTTGAPVESRVAPNRVEEDSDPDAVVGPAARPDVDFAGILPPRERDGRAELAARVAPAHFPADARQLRIAALEAGADDDLLEALLRLPAEERFENVEQVWEALGGHGEHR